MGQDISNPFALIPVFTPHPLLGFRSRINFGMSDFLSQDNEKERSFEGQTVLFKHVTAPKKSSKKVAEESIFV